MNLSLQISPLFLESEIDMDTPNGNFNITARPAGLTSQCEEYARNPLLNGGSPEDLPDGEAFLVRCKALVTHRLVLKNGADVYAVKFCDGHYQELKEKIEAGKSLVEILGDEEIEAHR